MAHKNISFIFLRTIALIAILFGAVASLYFVFNAGRNNNSILLRALFAVWTLSPFIAFLLAYAISRRWPYLKRITLYWLMLVVTFGSLVCYSGAFNTSKTKPAFIFLIVPLISWLLMIIVKLVARRLWGKTNDTSLNSNSNL